MENVSMNEVYQIMGKMVLRNEVLEGTVIQLAKENKELKEKLKGYDKPSEESKLPENES